MKIAIGFLVFNTLAIAAGLWIREAQHQLVEAVNTHGRVVRYSEHTAEQMRVILGAEDFLSAVEK